MSISSPILDALACGVVVLDATTPRRSIVHINPIACRLLGLTPEEATGQEFFGLAKVISLMSRCEELSRAVREQRCGTWPLSHRQENGTEGWVEVTLRSVPLTPETRQLVLTLRDTTNDPTVRNQLQLADERLRAAQRAARMGVWDWDLATDTLRWSDELFRLFGFQPGEFQPSLERFMSLIPKADVEIVREQLQASLQSDHPYEFDHRFFKSDGSLGWLSVHGYLERSAEGRPLRLWGTSQEITERKRTEESLRASESRQAELMHHLDGIIWEADPNTFAFRFVSSGAERLLGYPVQRWLDDPTFWQSHVHPDDRDRVVNFCKTSTAQGVNHDFEYRMLARNGRVVWLHDCVSVEMRDGVPVTIRGMMLDITGRKEAEAQAAFSHAVLEKAGDAILVCEVAAAGAAVRQPRIVYANEAFLQQMAYTREELLGLSPFRLLGPRTDPQAVALVETMLRRGESTRVELVTHRKDGSDFPVELDLKPVSISGPGITHIVIIQRDVTARRLLELRLRETQKLESLGLLAGGVAHDFNNLLTTILGYASLAQTELPVASPVLSHLLAIQESSQRAAELCQQLLAYAGRGRVIVGPFNLSQLVEQSVGLLRLSLSRKAVLLMQLAADLPSIQGDASQIRQVVMNLLMNASDALGDRDGTITLSTRLEILQRDDQIAARFGEELAEGPHIVLEFRDTGCGMDETTLGRIFDPFFTTKPSGRGLGMAAVLGIVKAHHGAISVRSEVGRGTTFRLFFPPCRSPATDSDNASSSKPTSTGRILVVDDEPGIRHLTGRMLSNLGFECVEAGDGQEGVDYIREQGDSLSAVLLDMMMPRLSGSEAYPQIRKLAPKLPVLVMSGYSASEVTTNFVDRQHLGFLQKPFAFSDLMKALAALLASRTSG